MDVATFDGRGHRLLTLIDEYTRECLEIRVARRLGSKEAIETPVDVMLARSVSEHLRSDNDPGVAEMGYPVGAWERYRCFARRSMSHAYDHVE